MRRQARQNRRKAWSAWLVIVAAVGVLVLGVSLIIQSLSAVAGESSPIVVATPSPWPPTSVTPTPTAPPAPSPAPWEFSQTHISIPSVGIEGDVSEYTAQNRADNGGRIVPPEKNSIVWDSYMYRVQGILSIPSASAQDCVYIAGHSYKDGSAIFNPLASMPIGAEVVITTASGETLTYVKNEAEVSILKEGQGSNPALNNPVPIPGCLKLVTCVSEGQRDANGHAISLRVTTLQLKPEIQPPHGAVE